MLQQVKYKSMLDDNKQVRRIIRLLSRRIEEKTGLRLYESDDRNADIIIGLSPDIKAEGYRITDGDQGQIIVYGGSNLGVLYGLGKLLRDADYDEGFFQPGNWRGISEPDGEVRGIYLATHKHNFYHDAPVSAVEEYIEDLTIWGFNAILVWFDMHHYTAITDPEALDMSERLKRILQSSQELGLKTGFLVVANEAYKNSPVELRADWTSGHDGYVETLASHYHNELCPSKHGSIKLLKEMRKEFLDVFSETQPDYLCFFPYDEGGCTCSDCKPWGANGYLKAVEALAGMVKNDLPKTKIVLGTWFFDRFTTGEWKGLDERFRESTGYADYIMADSYMRFGLFPDYPIKHGVPGNLPMINFTDISMYGGAAPWGGYGTNPHPAHLQEHWDVCGDYVTGGFPYSEGIFEDMNKAVVGCLYWNRKTTTHHAIQEYIKFEYSRVFVNEILKIVNIYEDTLHRQRTVKDKEGNQRYKIIRTKGIDEAYDAVKDIDSKLQESVRKSWRWRIFFLRAVIDYEMKKDHFTMTSQVNEQAFQKLTEIYYAQRAEFNVAPPTKKARKRAKGQLKQYYKGEN